MPVIWHSLKLKILGIVMLLFCVGILLETGIWVRSTVHQTQSTVSENLQSSLRVSNQNFENTVKDIDRVSALASSVSESSHCVSNYLRVMEPESSATDLEKVTYGREVYDYLFQLCSYKHYLNGMAIYNLQGSQQKFGIMMSEQELLEQPWLSDFMESDKEVIFVPPHKSIPNRRNYGQNVFSIVRKIRYGNTVRGLVLADIKYDLFEDFYDFAEITDYQLTIVDETNHIVVYPETQADFSRERITESEYLLLERQMPMTNWTVYGYLPYRTILSDSMSSLRQVLLVVAAIAILVCIGITVAVIHMTRNLTRLTKAVQKISMDDLQLDIDIDSTDETGTLYRQINHMLDRINTLIVQIQEAENEKRELEIMALQEQINPHFLYNTLNTISMLASFRGMKNIQDVTAALTDMLHLVLDPAKYITVEEEVNYIRRYLEIMEYKYSGKFQTEIELDERAKGYMIPKMLLQPIVENSLKHGIATITGPGLIRVSIQYEEEVLAVRVRDNGKGMSPSVMEELNQYPPVGERTGEQIGVRNVRNRLFLIFGEKSAFRIESVPEQFTIVEIRIPCMKAGEI